jgi:hypothetical protein
MPPHNQHQILEGICRDKEEQRVVCRSWLSSEGVKEPSRSELEVVVLHLPFEDHVHEFGAFEDSAKEVNVLNPSMDRIRRLIAR